MHVVNTLEKLSYCALRCIYRFFNIPILRHVERLEAEKSTLCDKIDRITEFGPDLTRLGVLNDVRFYAYNFLRLGKLDLAQNAFRCAASLYPGELRDEQSTLDAFLRDMLPHAQGFVEHRPGKTLPSWCTKDRRILLNLAVWGEDYVRLMTDYLFPSLLASGNLPALQKEADIFFYIITTPEDRELIENSIFFTRVQDYCRVEFLEFDSNLAAAAAESTNDARRYWLNGGLQQIMVLYAHDLNADIVYLTPDTVYSEEALKGLTDLVERDHDAVVMMSLRTERETFARALDDTRHEDGLIELDARSLNNLAMDHLHPLTRRAFMYPDNQNFLIGHLNLYWEVPGAVYIHAPHQLPAIISHRVLHDDVLMDCSIDTVMMSRLFPDETAWARIHRLERFDPISYFEMTSTDRDVSPSRSGFPFEMHARDIFWHHCNAFNFWLFQHRQEIPCDVQPNIGRRTKKAANAEVESLLRLIDQARDGPDRGEAI